jgi:F-box and WD-40 domain protein 1/11
MVAVSPDGQSETTLIEDNEVWRKLFYGHEGWTIDLPRAMARGWTPSPRDTITDVAPLTLNWRVLYQTRLNLDHRWVHEAPKVAHILGHTENVYCVEFDSTRIITGSADKSIKVWSLRNGELLGTFQAHTGSVLCLRFDKDWDIRRVDHEPDEDSEVKPGFMISGSSDCSIRVWDLRVDGDGGVDAEVRAVLQEHTGGVLDLRFNEQWIVSW